ncbi:MAG: hypothetical protein IPP93_19220 [Chitinophagaceae bacterium]|nr:hypothetical protein [Chitinophagaceae bacterium]
MKQASLLFILTVCLCRVHAQDNAALLDFEQEVKGYSPVNWVKSAYSKKIIRFERDSQQAQHGKFALRITEDNSGNGNSDGAMYINLPLDVSGKTLRFSFYAKQTVPGDTAGSVSCIISEDRGEKKTLIAGRSIIQAKGWTFFSKEVSLDSLKLPVHHLRVNILAKSPNPFWVDNLSVEIDGKNISDIPSMASRVDEKPAPLTALQQTNLAHLCRIWGFLKYFHPAVAEGKFNWNAELFRMIPQVMHAANQKELSTLFTDWIESLEPINICDTCDNAIPANSFTNNIDLGWMSSPDFNEALQHKLQYILVSRHRGSGFYAEYQQLKNLSFNNDPTYANWRDIEFPNLNFRLEFLFRYWNIIQYFYPYKYEIGQDWNKILADFLPRFITAHDVTAYHLLMTEFVNSVNDSHSVMQDEMVPEELAPYRLPVKTVIINHTAVVNGFYSDSMAKLGGFRIGDQITSIGGKSIDEIIAERSKWANGSNVPVKLAFLCSYGYITGGKDSIIPVSLKRDQQQISLDAKRYRGFPFNKNTEPAWTLTATGIGYVHMGLLKKEDIDQMFLSLKNTSAIIFDLRHYPKSTVMGICEYLYEKRTCFAKVMHPDLDFPGSFQWLDPICYMPGNGKSHYTGKIIILVNENTQSQAEWTAMAFQAVPGTVTIGSQTSGADGDVSYLYLAGNYNTTMTGLGIFYPDGTPTQRRGIKIDIVVHPTVNGIRSGKDEVLEKALELAGGQ